MNPEETYSFTIEGLALHLTIKNKGWRYGQAVFNATYQLFPEVANKLRATSVDCFYQDSKVNDFLKAVANLQPVNK
jgi:hypothetical protein